MRAGPFRANTTWGNHTCALKLDGTAVCGVQLSTARRARPIVHSLFGTVVCCGKLDGSP